HPAAAGANSQEPALAGPPLELQLNPLREIAVRDCVDHARDLGRRPYEVLDHRVDRVELLLPGTARPAHRGALRQPAFAADHGRDAHELVGRALTRLCEVVERAGQAARHALAPGGDTDAAFAALGGGEGLEQR